MVNLTHIYIYILELGINKHFKNLFHRVAVGTPASKAESPGNHMLSSLLQLRQEFPKHGINKVNKQKKAFL